MAARPRTLPAAAAPVLVGSAVAFYEDVFQFAPTLAALLCALLLQVGANIANDVFDFRRGADTTDRLGPPRVTAMGLLSPRRALAGMWIALGLAGLIGAYLVAVGGWPILLSGLLAIASAIAYTGGPFPLGYNGLGDVFVFVFFGPVAVCGTYYVQAGTVSGLAVWASIPVGFLVVAILVVNNVRDVDTDRAAGKRTLAVRLGDRAARFEYALLMIVSYLLPLILAVAGVAPAWVLLTWLSVPLAIRLTRRLLNERGRVLNQALSATGQLALAYGVFFALGLIVSRLQL
jgi:1,4-dihydroxy-2-naphthoate octaprenyltransferase